MAKLTTKKAVAVLIAFLAVAGLMLFLRGPYVSNLLKKLVLPQVQSATGRQVIAQKIYVNLLPFFIDARGVKVFDDEGERLMSVESVKAYIGLSGILKGQASVDTIVLKSPEVSIRKAQAGEIVDNIRSAGKGADGPVSFGPGNIVVMDGRAEYYDEGAGVTLLARGIEVEAALGERPDVKLSAESFHLERKGWPAIDGSVRASFMVGAGEIDIKRINLDVDGSGVSGTGNYSTNERKGSFRLDLNARVDTVKKLFGLKESGYGSIRARGRLDLEDGLRDPQVDFNVSGDFNLETLLELVRAKRSHRLTGLISFNGSLEGNISDLRGTANARIKNALLYGVELDDATTRVEYSDRLLSLKEGRGKFYGGTGEVEMSFPLPSASPYTVDVKFRDIKNTDAFGLISMSWLEVPNGKVSGAFYTSGRKFRPEGWASYEAGEASDDPLGRVKTIKGRYELENNVVTLTEMEVRSDASTLRFGGSVDIGENTLDLNGSLLTEDVREFSTPYFGRLSGRGRFEGGVSGPINDPVVKGKLWVTQAYLDDYPLGDIKGEASYRKNLFEVSEALARHEGSVYRGKGTVAFPKAEGLLQFEDAEYGINISLAAADLQGLLKMHKVEVPLKGTADGEVAITGSGWRPLYSGKAKVRDAVLYGYPVDEAELRFSYDFERFSVMEAFMKRGASSASLDGSIDKEGAFEFKSSAKGIYTADLSSVRLPFNYRMDVEAEGRGTFEEPEIVVEAALSEGTFRGGSFGGGSMRARLVKRAITYEAEVLDGKLKLVGDAALAEPYPWTADVDIRPGRYDFLVSAFLKQVPEDMLFNMVGKARLKGTKDSLGVSAALEQANLTLYGQNFTNESPILFSVDGPKVVFESVSLRSGNTSVNIHGDLTMDENFNILMDGSSSLSPLKAFSDSFSVLRGQTRFVLALQGEWNNPAINGGIELNDASLGIEGISQRLASINGYSYFDGDTVVIQKLGAKLGGGDIEVSGFVRLEHMRPVRANLDMLFNEVNLTMSKGFKANLGGNVIFKADPDSSIIVGEVILNRADYKDPLEWRTWLLKVKQTGAARPKSGLLDDIKLSVRLYGDKDIEVDNNVARAKLKIDTVLRGTVGSPVLFGRVEAEDGSVYFRNSEFKIVRATADFFDTEKTEPYVDIVAETSVKGYHIWLTLEGKVQQLDMTLISDPELEDVEILSLLTVGEFGERLRGLEGGIGAAEATSVITGGFQEIVEERLRELTGITRFTIDPYVSRTTGTITPRVTVSKSLMGERLYVTYSSSMSTAEEQEVKLEYRVTSNVSLLGGQDDQGALGGDVKFRFRFK